MALNDSSMTNNIISTLESKEFVASGEHSHIKILVDAITQEVVRAITNDAEILTPDGSGSIK